MQFGVTKHEFYFSKIELHASIGQVLFVVFEKFTSAYLNQIAQEIMLLLANNLHEKPITESQNG